MAERLTQNESGRGWAMKLDNPQNEIEERQQLMQKFKVACEKLAHLEDIMEKCGVESVEKLYVLLDKTLVKLRNEIVEELKEIIQQDRDTWKKACELAVESLKIMDGCPYDVDYFYQQARAWNNQFGLKGDEMLSEEGKMVKRELENFNQAKRRLRNLQNELESWRRMDGALKSASLEQHTDGGEVVPYAERRVIRMQELYNFYLEAKEKAEELENIFLKDVKELDITCQNLLLERYAEGKPLRKIIREFNYSERQIYNLYNKAFEKLSERLQ